MYGNSNSGESLPLIIVLIIVAVGGVIGFSRCNGADHKSAEKEFRSWAKSLDLQHDKVTCNGYDGDGDGYVSCTYVTSGEVKSIECAGAWSLQHGCRAPKLLIRQQ